MDNSALSSHAKGKQGEQIAVAYLQARGYRILTTNYRAVGAEIDIIAFENKELVALEVKSCRYQQNHMADMITHRKKMKIARALRHFLATQYHSSAPVRMEVLLINLTQGTVSHFREEFFDF